jgi:hypothetical protein
MDFESKVNFTIQCWIEESFLIPEELELLFTECYNNDLLSKESFNLFKQQILNNSNYLDILKSSNIYQYVDTRYPTKEVG